MGYRRRGCARRRRPPPSPERILSGGALTVRASTHRGLIRERNEDCVGVGGWVSQGDRGTVVALEATEPELRAGVLCVVSDGVGGHARGDDASHAAVRAVATGHGRGERDPAELVRLAQEGIRALGDADRGRPPAATCVGLLFDETEVCVFNVGDSRAYRIRDGYLQQLSVDHRSLNNSGALSQVLSGASTAEAHVWRSSWVPGDRFALVTDGVSDLIDHAELALLLSDPDLESVCSSVTSAVLEAGARDNLTLVVCELPAGAVVI